MSGSSKNVKLEKNSIFLKNGKTVISIENLKIFWISDGETAFTVGIVSQNIVTMSNFVGFRDGWTFTFFEASGLASDTWHLVEWLN